MGDRTQRMKGKSNEMTGEARTATGRQLGSRKTEAKGMAQTLKGRAQQAMGNVRSTAKKKTR